MEKISLTAKIREEIGKEAVKKLRRQESIPAVVYKAQKALSIKIPTKDFLKVIHTKAGENVIVHLQIKDETKDKGKGASSPRRGAQPAVIKEIQYHPVTGDILHVDFNEISLTQVLTVKVPIVAKGEAEGLKEGGVLEHALWEVEVECLPTEIPENIPVDVSPLKIGDSILIKDLQAPQGVKILGEPQTTVITLAAPHVEEEEAVKPEEEMAEPEVIMEKKPQEEEASAEEAQGQAPAKGPRGAGKESGKE